MGRPRAVPALEVERTARELVADVRTCTLLMEQSAEVMHASSAPRGFEGDPAEISHHAMTQTAVELDLACVALQHGVVALDRYCDETDHLRRAHATMLGRHAVLEATAERLDRRRSELLEAEDPGDGAAGLDDEVRAHNGRVERLDDDAESWSRALAAAEDRLVAALSSADSVAEARVLQAGAIDTTALVAEVSPLVDDPAAVLAWWLQLGRRHREALKAVWPQLIGNLDGIPLIDRDEANRAALDARYQSLRERQRDGTLTEEDEGALQAMKNVQAALDLGHDASAHGEHVPAYLMMFDPEAAHGDGFGAIAFGNPETADHVSVNVPGFSSTLSSIESVAGAAAHVHRAASGLTSGSVASIAWLGYDAPDVSASPEGLGARVLDGRGVAGPAMAEAGADRLARFVEGLQVGHRGHPHLTVIGHSYGSTTVGIAAGDDMEVDDVILAGSPGAGPGNDHASDLHGDVYVASADEDPITRIGGTGASLGADPASAAFGADRIRADSQSDLDLRGAKRDVDLNHGSYFEGPRRLDKQEAAPPSSRPLADVAKVVAGHSDDAGLAPRRTWDNRMWWARFFAEINVESRLDVVTSGGAVPWMVSRVIGQP